MPLHKTSHFRPHKLQKSKIEKSMKKANLYYKYLDYCQISHPNLFIKKSSSLHNFRNLPCILVWYHWSRYGILHKSVWNQYRQSNPCHHQAPRRIISLANYRPDAVQYLYTLYASKILIYCLNSLCELVHNI